jgi:TM2 domain-containing membrane protein YozV
MNCAVHTETTATAYCRTCGKPMCPACAHNVRGVIYCEDCLAQQIGAPAGTAAPAAGFVPTPTPGVPVVVTSSPSPGLAGVLAGFFPFGVGQVYTGQYAKGLAHLLIFVALIFGVTNADNSNNDAAAAVLGISMAFFYVYQIIDAVRSAKAIQFGQAPPDPFGLARTFTTATGEKTVDARQVPLGAVILIGLGVLFLLDTMDLFPLHWMGRAWPLILIVLGVWMFMKRMSPPAAGGGVQGGQ